MADSALKSSRFRREREATWRELDQLIGQWERRGPRGLSAAESLRLPVLYRATLSSLSVARAISLDRNLLDYLESLSARAYFCVHGIRAGMPGALAAVFVMRLPQAMRQASHAFLLALGVLLLGVACGYLMTSANEDWFFAFVGGGMADGRDPDATTEFLLGTLYEFDAERLPALKAFAGFLLSHNAAIGVMCFALGFAFGIPVVLLVFSTGTMLGAMLALFAGRGLFVPALGWVSIHGVTEIAAVLWCAAAGITLGWTMAFPGRRRRVDALARAGRDAAVLAIGAVAMFLLAAILEGFGRQLVTQDGTRLLIAAVTLVLWIAYPMLAGRKAPDG